MSTREQTTMDALETRSSANATACAAQRFEKQNICVPRHSVALSQFCGMCNVSFCELISGWTVEGLRINGTGLCNLQSETSYRSSQSSRFQTPRGSGWPAAAAAPVRPKNAENTVSNDSSVCMTFRKTTADFSTVQYLAHN